MKHYILLLLAGLLPCLLVAQPKKKCGQVQHTQKVRAMQGYPLLQQQKTPREIPCESMIIPVAVHFMNTNASRACLERIVAEQIASLNADFAGTNKDIGKFELVEKYFPFVRPDSNCIQFRVADNNHPSLSNLQDGQLAITINELENGTDWSFMWADYLNIFVFDIEDNVLGYAPLRGTGKGDGVAITNFAFGGTGNCGQISSEPSYDRGRTLTHEVAHYLGVPHIWGNTGGCEQDDGFGDTPFSDQPNFDCFGPAQISCGTHDLSMNYMDYTQDDCMYMFTPKQGHRMKLSLQIHQSHLVDKGKQVISDLQAITPIDDPIDNTENTEETDTENDTENESTEENPLDSKHLLFTILLLVIIALSSWIYDAFKGKK